MHLSHRVRNDRLFESLKDWIASEGKGDLEKVLQGNPSQYPLDLIDFCLARQAFVERFANSEALIIGSHFSDPTAGWIVRNGPGWKLRTD